MKKVYSNKFIVYFCIFGIILFLIPAIICFVSLINSIMNERNNMIIANSIFIFGFLCFCTLNFILLNRFGYKIIYDRDNGIINREGFICGYKYQLKVEDIKEIIVATFPKETTYYVFIDSINKKYDGGSNKSFIRIEKNKNNYEFITQFWDKPIKEYNEYKDLF